MVESALRIEWIRDMRTIEALRDPWVALEQRVHARTVYSRYDYVISWYHCYSHTDFTDNGNPLVGLAWADDKLVGIAPMIESSGTFTKIPVHRIDLAGYTLSVGGMLIADGHFDVVTRWAESLMNEHMADVVQLEGMSIDTAGFQAFRDRMRENGIPVEIAKFHWYAVADLQKGYQAYTRARTGNFRKQIHKIERRMSTFNSVQIDRLTSLVGSTCAVEMLDRMFALSEGSWRVRRVGLGVDRQHQRLYRELVERFGSLGAIDLAILVLDGTDAAFSLALIERGVYYHTLIAYDEKFSAYSPGSYLLQRVFASLPERDVHTVLSHGPYEYKKRWASRVVPQYTVCLFDKTLRARAARVLGFHLIHRNARVKYTADDLGQYRTETT